VTPPPEEIKAFKYRAFICYSQQDRVTAERLHHRLENYRVPKHLIGRARALGPVPSRLSPIFRDREELAASSDIGTELREAIRQSQFLIVLCSPAAARSRWVNAEIEIFRDADPENAHRILAVIVAGEPGSPDSEMECFPPALRIEASGSEMPMHFPLAADFRSASENHEDAELRLIAALLGVSFDELKRREHAQRLRKLRHVVTASAILVLIFAAVAVFAFAQRGRAQKAAAHATRAREEAEKLVDFMIVDLREKLEAIGKLSLLEPANEKVRRYYETVAPEEENPELLRHSAIALTQRGDDLQAKGDPKGAKEFFLSAKAIRERLAALKPLQAEWRRELAATHNKLGEVSRRQNDLTAALAEHTAAVSILNALVQEQPSNAEWQHDLAYSNMKVGEILLQSGKTALAQAEFQRAVDILGRLATNSAPADLKLDLISALNQLGDAQRNAGQKRDSETNFRRAISINEESLTKEPDNAKFLERLQFSHALLGQTLAESLRMDEAMEQRQTSLKINRQLAALEPENVRYQRGVSTACAQIGELLCQQNKYAEADSYVREALALAEQLVAKHPGDKQCLADVPFRLNLLSDLYLGLGKKADALRATEQAIEVRRKICAQDPVNKEMKHWLAYDTYVAGSALLELNRPTEAEECAQQSMAIANELIAADPANLVPLQFRTVYELQFGAALRDEGKGKESEIAYRQCLKTVELYVSKGGSPESVHYAREESEKALQKLHSKTASK
jgi:eukaryotic-like serine/threonine-protein kinase